MRVTTGSMRCGVAAVALAAAACGSTTTPTPSSASPTATVASSATATPTPAPLAIGDPCLVGRWTETALDELDTNIFPGTAVHISGGSGVVVTLTAAGTETDEWSNAAPYTGSGGGHTYSNMQRGTLQYGFHAMAGHWAETGGSGQTTSHEVLDGVPRADYIARAGPPGSGTYSCSSSTLTLVQTAPIALTLTLTR